MGYVDLGRDAVDSSRGIGMGRGEGVGVPNCSGMTMEREGGLEIFVF